jgi:hypothetical protein
VGRVRGRLLPRMGSRVPGAGAGCTVRPPKLEGDATGGRPVDAVLIRRHLVAFSRFGSWDVLAHRRR